MHSSKENTLKIRIKLPGIGITTVLPLPVDNWTRKEIEFANNHRFGTSFDNGTNDNKKILAINVATKVATYSTYQISETSHECNRFTWFSLCLHITLYI